MLLTFLGSFGDDGGLRPDKEVMELGEGHRTRKKKEKESWSRGQVVIRLWALLAEAEARSASFD